MIVFVRHNKSINSVVFLPVYAYHVFCLLVERGTVGASLKHGAGCNKPWPEATSLTPFVVVFFVWRAVSRGGRIDSKRPSKNTELRVGQARDKNSGKRFLIV